MDQENLCIRLRTIEIIARFKNGEERYRTSVTFNRVVQMLARGVNTFEVIDQLITITDDTRKAFEQYMLSNTKPVPITIPQDEG